MVLYKIITKSLKTKEANKGGLAGLFKVKTQ